MRWQCYLNTDMGWERIEDDFPAKFNRNDVTRAFEGRFGLEVSQVNPTSVGANYTRKGIFSGLFS